MDVLEGQVQEEISQRRDSWLAAQDQGCTMRGYEYVHEAYLCWGARYVIMLAEEWEVRQAGAEGYVLAYALNQLPWQRAYRSFLLYCTSRRA